MANGTTRIALSKIQLDNKSGTAELNEEMKLDKGNLPKIPMKYPSEHNHSK